MAFLKAGEQFPPARDIPRLAKYKRMERIYDGDVKGVYDRAQTLLRDTPSAPQLDKLYIAVNLVDVLTTKPADLLVGEGITIETKHDDESPEQRAINRIVRKNNINALIYEAVIGAGIRGDAWIRAYYADRDDTSAVEALGLAVDPAIHKPEPVLEAVPAHLVFPEVSRRNAKRFRAVNVCTVEYDGDTAYLNVERQLPGYIVYERYQLEGIGVTSEQGADIELFTVVRQVDTGREEDVFKTGVQDLLIQHVPYKARDNTWRGVGNIEKIEDVLSAINDRLVQIDYILWKHSDPHMYGPDIESSDGEQRLGGGIYIPMNPDDKTTPGYLTWNSQLEGAFKQLDYLLSLVFQMTETPQWLFGTTITQDRGGTGTSHSDGRAIQMRLLPILSKVNRIKIYAERAFADLLYLVQKLEVYANKTAESDMEFEAYIPQHPKILWNSPIPRDPKEEAEIANLRTGGKPTLDQQSAIKRLDSLDDDEALKIIGRIGEDDVRHEGTVDSSIFNAEVDDGDDS